ncbi:MucBP domain-containing protein [Vagococcus salmoninarum]|uniref:MucBP domain-containing protein n=1 Tax=Vagococcus salmoninarum TaxID=2739 RepID=A0A429ZCC8_9ENTE|nr:MucBP domain-containing protein [Vagococcus salmoninarum]RST91334.1 hypothetical protein CBF35_14505 [Vagococcus salmoninarum]
MKVKWQQLLTTSLILSCFTSSALMPTKASAQETLTVSSSGENISSTEATETTGESSENSGTEDSKLMTTPIKIANQFSAGISPNAKFTGTVGSHPILETFGDVEGEGVLANAKRDVGQYKVLPFESGSTPGRQMAMKLGNFQFNRKANYPNDGVSVSSLVYEKAINYDRDRELPWRSVFMDTASVGVLSNNGTSFLDINASSVKEGVTRSRELPGKDSRRAEENQRTKGMLVGQAGSEGASTMSKLNSIHYKWSFKPENSSGGGLASGNTAGDAVVLMKMYHSPDPKVPYSVAYGAHVFKSKNQSSSGPVDLLGYVRIIQQPVNDEGRVRITYSYVNLTNDSARAYSAFYMNYTSMLDDTRSKGDNVGEYFSRNIVGTEGVGYAYVIYRDDYPILPDGREVNPPTGRYVKKAYGNSSFNLGITPSDPGKNKPFANKNLGYVGKKQETSFGEVASWDLDVQGFNMFTLKVHHVYKDTGRPFKPTETSSWLYGDEYKTQPKIDSIYRAAKPYPENQNGKFVNKNIEVTYEYELIPTHGDVLTHYKDINGNEISSSSKHTGKIGGANYLAKPKAIDGYVYVKTAGTEDVNVDVKIEEETQEVTFTYMKTEDIFTLKQEVVNSSDESINEGQARQGEPISYRGTLNTAKEIKDRGYAYQSADFNLDVDQNLENIESIELKDSEGNIVGSGNYDSENNQLTAELTNQQLLTEKDIVLTYDATVKMSAKVSDEIKQKTKADVVITFSEITSKVIKEVSNEVTTTIESGQLELISAPLEVNFGQIDVIDFQNKIGTDKTNVSQPLSVVDKRVTPQKWEVVAEVIKDMTNGDHELTGALKYRYKNRDLTLGSNVKIIYENDGSAAGTEVNITDTWGTDSLENGLKLNVPPTEVPKTTGNYEGIIKWTLRETIE